MKMFVIDNAGKISAIQPESVTEGQTTFTTDTELAAVTSEWPSGKLVEIWNQLPGVTAVRKFTDRKSAVVADLEGRSDPRACCCPTGRAQDADEEGRGRAGRPRPKTARPKRTKPQRCWTCFDARAVPRWTTS